MDKPADKPADKTADKTKEHLKLRIKLRIKALSMLKPCPQPSDYDCLHTGKEVRQGEKYPLTKELFLVTTRDVEAVDFSAASTASASIL